MTSSSSEPPRPRITVRLSAHEHARLVEAARVNRQTLSAFVRAATAEATADCLEDVSDTARKPR
jgi:uncharacterized protein (DUF1778 family)